MTSDDRNERFRRAADRLGELGIRKADISALFGKSHSWATNVCAGRATTSEEAADRLEFLAQSLRDRADAERLLVRAAERGRAIKRVPAYASAARVGRMHAAGMKWCQIEYRIGAVTYKLRNPTRVHGKRIDFQTHMAIRRAYEEWRANG